MPARQRVLDESRQPTDKIAESQRGVSFISPVPKPRKAGRGTQTELAFDADSKALATGNQRYELTALIDSLPQELVA